MAVKTLENNGISIAVCDTASHIGTISDVLDLLATATYGSECAGLVLLKESLPEAFFDLKTGFAGDVLQKFSNYRMKLAIVGDFSQYTSQSLKDFIYECNKGRLVFFKHSLDEAMTALTASP
ncbi:DUF4180 domain-containing protein [Oscillospiraceae bacterium CM]|nr:DUF4180 domain-containing protein [Oscillospiraceae bacterium CM]